MSGTKAAIIVVIVLFTLALVGIVLYTSQTRTPTSSIVTPPLAPESPLPSVSPTPSEQTIEGEILTVSTSPVEFKNSYVATVEQTDGTSALLYITDDTIIQNSQGNEVTRTSLRSGTSVIVVATPSEGGFEAVQIQIVPSSGTTPTVLPTRNVPTEPPTN